MALRKTDEQELPPPTPASWETQAPAPPLVQAPTFAHLLAAFAALGAATGQRIGLLLAGSAAFALAWRVLDAPSPNAIWVSALFSIIVFLPMVALNARRAT